MDSQEKTSKLPTKQNKSLEGKNKTLDNTLTTDSEESERSLTAYFSLSSFLFLSLQIKVSLSTDALRLFQPDMSTH